MAGVKGKSGRLPGRDTRDFSLLINRCYNYLLHNFSKLEDNKKLHIALELIKKAMPNQVNVDGNVTHHLADKVQDGRIRASELKPSRN